MQEQTASLAKFNCLGRFSARLAESMCDRIRMSGSPASEHCPHVWPWLWPGTGVNPVAACPLRCSHRLDHWTRLTPVQTGDGAMVMCSRCTSVTSICRARTLAQSPTTALHRSSTGGKTLRTNPGVQCGGAFDRSVPRWRRLTSGPGKRQASGSCGAEAGVQIATLARRASGGPCPRGGLRVPRWTRREARRAGHRDSVRGHMAGALTATKSAHGGKMWA